MNWHRLFLIVPFLVMTAYVGAIKAHALHAGSIELMVLLLAAGSVAIAPARESLPAGIRIALCLLLPLLYAFLLFGYDFFLTAWLLNVAP
jgi:hypothetical protein